MVPPTSTFASPDHAQWAPGLAKTRSGKIMRRILRKITENVPDQLGDISTRSFLALDEVGPALFLVVFLVAMFFLCIRTTTVAVTRLLARRNCKNMRKLSDFHAFLLPQSCHRFALRDGRESAEKQPITHNVLADKDILPPESSIRRLRERRRSPTRFEETALHC